MKRRLIIGTLIIMSLTLCACSKQEKADTTSNQDIKVASEQKDEDKQTEESKDASKTEEDKTKTQEDKTKKQEDKTKKQTNKSEPQKQNTVAKEKYFGDWVIKKQVAALKVQALSSDDINSLIGKKVSFSKEKANSFHEQVSDLKNVVNNPKYTKKTLSKDEFESQNRNYVTFEKLGIKGNSITEIEVTDSKQGNCCTFYIKDDNTIILSGGGVFFRLDRN